jgi:Rieske Fe-S protein
VIAWLTPVTASAQDGARARPAAGDWLVKTGDPSLTPLTPDDVPRAGAPVLAWPMAGAGGIVRSDSRLNRIVLVRLDPETLSARTRTRAALGVVAYSAVCTHSGCDVGSWFPGRELLHCECHESLFDPRDAARVIDGPAPRSLPALPLDVVEGRLTVAAPFTSRAGYEPGAIA